MTQPAVNQTEIDGALGILPAQDGKALCIISTCAGGPLNTPAAFGGTAVKAMRTAFVAGPGVQLAAYSMQRYGKSVLMVGAGSAIDGSYLNAVVGVAGSIGAITKTGTGSSTYSDNSSVPLDGAAWQILFLVGGTRGTTGIVYQILRNGVTVAPGAVSLGTATSITSGTGISIAISAGTIVAGDFIAFTTVAPVASSAGTLVDTAGGSSVITVAAVVPGTIEPNDDYQPWLQFLTSGTIGVAGITLKWSLDNGTTKSETTTLGTDNFFIFPGSGGIKVLFAAGTISALRTISFDAVAPQWNTSELQLAIIAAKNSAIPWETVAIVGPLDGAAYDLIETLLPDKKHNWFASTRMPIGTESDATYQASLAAQWSSRRTSVYGSLCSGPCDLISAIDGRKYRRPAMFPLVAQNAKVDAQVNISQIDLGALPGCSIRDDNGNAKHHDESINPGLDDLGFHVLRTWEEDIAAGVFSNRPRLFSPPGSDFNIVPKRRVMNIAHIVMRSFLAHRLNKEIQVSKKTGLILPTVRKEIENNARAALEAALLAGKVKASGVFVTVSDSDQLLKGAPLTGSYRIEPLAYPEFADFEGGFINPVSTVVAV